MSTDMSLQDFADKVEWEGGVAGAIEYGLTSDDLTLEAREGNPELVAAWNRAVEAQKVAEAACLRAEAALSDAIG